MLSPPSIALSVIEDKPGTLKEDSIDNTIRLVSFFVYVPVLYKIEVPQRVGNSTPYAQPVTELTRLTHPPINMVKGFGLCTSGRLLRQLLSR